jgi:hypothetical protein
MNAPEVRLSPCKTVVALRFEDNDGWPWAATDSGYYTDAEVSEWTPLLPVSNKDGA